MYRYLFKLPMMAKVRIVAVAESEQVIERPFTELALNLKDIGLISSYLFC